MNPTASNHPTGATSQAAPRDMSSLTATTTPTVQGMTRSELAEKVRTASAEEQRLTFSQLSHRGAWERCYTALAELRAIPRPYKAPLAVVMSGVWNNVSSASFERFQRLFCDSHELVVPGDIRLATTQGIPSLPSAQKSPWMYSVLGCFVDPQRVPVPVANKLGLLSPKKRTYEERLTDCSDRKVTTGLKYYWECSVPLGTRAPTKPNQSIRIIAPPTKQIQATYAPFFKDSGFKPSTEQLGAILYTREAAPKAAKLSSHFTPLTVQYFSSAYDALRKTYHEEAQYNSEHPDLAELKNRWETFKSAILPRWVSADALEARLRDCSSDHLRTKLQEQATKDNETVISHYKPLLASSITFYKGSVHQEKQEILQRLQRMQQDLENSPSGRLNPRHVDPQSGANIVRHQLRLEDIRVKDSFNKNDQKLLLSVIQEHTGIFRNLHQAILNNAAILEQRQPLFTKNALRGYEILREATAVRSRLMLGTIRLKDIKVKPFFDFKQPIEKADKELDTALKRGNRQAAQEALSKMLCVTRAFHLNNAAEMIQLSLAEGDSMVFVRLQAARNDLTEALGRQQAFANPTVFERSEINAKVGHITTSFFDTLDKLISGHQQMTTQERALNNALPDPEIRKNFAKQVTAALANFDFISLAKRI